jgi:hypothetical protein
MTQFVLLAGIHADKNGVYAPGDRVESDTDLAKWPEKFIEWTDADEAAGTPEPETKEESK